MDKGKTKQRYAQLCCRINGRIRHEAVELAASLGRASADFTESAFADKGQAVLGRNECIALSKRDFARIVAAVEKPAEPTVALKALMTEHRQRVKC